MVTSSQVQPETGTSRILNDHAGHGAFVAWLCKWAGYDEAVLCERASASWFVLLVAFPVHWATIAILLCVFGLGTKWEPWFLLTLIPHSLNMLVHSPLSLKYSVKQLQSSWVEFVWGEVFVHGGGYALIVVSVAGFLTTAINIPFNSVTWTSMALFVLTPLMFLVDHITNYSPTAIRGGNTPVSIAVFHFTNGMRFVDPLADFVLGYNLLQQVQQRNCPWYDGREHGQAEEATSADCWAHQVISWTIISASLTDFLILAGYINFMKTFVKEVPDVRKQRFVEVVMLLCELSILIAVIIISRFNMMASGATAGVAGTGRDLNGYVALCSISTFSSLLTTIIMLVVPASFWERLEEEGAVTVWRQVVLGCTLHAYSLVRRVSTGAWLGTSRRGERVSTAAGPHAGGGRPTGNMHVPASPGIHSDGMDSAKRNGSEAMSSAGCGAGDVVPVAVGESATVDELLPVVDT